MVVRMLLEEGKRRTCSRVRSVLPFLLFDDIGLRTVGVDVGVAAVGVEPMGALAGLRSISLEEYCRLPGGSTGARPLKLPPPVPAVPIPGAETLMPAPPPTNNPPPGDVSHAPLMF